MLEQSKFFKSTDFVNSSFADYIGTMSIEQPRIVANVGVAFEIIVTCDIPISESFAVPLNGLFGSEGRTVNLDFVNGVAQRELVFEKSGEWQVTENEINAHLPLGQKFRFDGLVISVAE